MNSRYLRDKFVNGLVHFSTLITLSILVIIVGFIFIKGLPMVNLKYITNAYDADTQYVMLNKSDTSMTYTPKEGEVFIEKFGFAVTEGEDHHKRILNVTYIDKNSPANSTTNVKGTPFPIKEGYVINKIDKKATEKFDTFEETIAALEANDSVRVRALKPGGGIWPMIVATLLLIVITLAIAVPIGVCAAIYLVEYAKPGRMVDTIRFATESLAGIPSIVYGLFGMLFFVKMLKVGESTLAGALTLGIILLPTIIRTTEETLKTVPISYKEASFGLGANRLQTLWHVILPSAIPGILVAVILSIGRIVGESAALLFTMGTFAKIPSGIRDSGATLTVRAYVEVKEYGNVEMAAGIGVVLMLIVFILNISAKLISKRLTKV